MHVCVYVCVDDMSGSMFYSLCHHHLYSNHLTFERSYEGVCVGGASLCLRSASTR
jgi:hypothetical protein